MSKILSLLAGILALVLAILFATGYKVPSVEFVVFLCVLIGIDNLFRFFKS